MENMNSLKYTGLLGIVYWHCCWCICCFLRWWPCAEACGYLGDVRRPSKPVSEPDSLLPPPPEGEARLLWNTCRAGMTCIEDYSDSTMRAWRGSYQALDELASTPSGSYRLFGDSFIEGGYSDGWFTRDASAEIWRLRSRFCHHYVPWPVASVLQCVIPSADGRVILSWTLLSLTVASWESPDITLFRIPVLMWNCGAKKYASRLDTCQRASIFSITVAQIHPFCPRQPWRSNYRDFWADWWFAGDDGRGNIGSGPLDGGKWDSNFVLWPFAMDGKELCWITSLCVAVPAYPSVLFRVDDAWVQWTASLHLIILQYGTECGYRAWTELRQIHCRCADNSNASQGCISASSHPL